MTSNCSPTACNSLSALPFEIQTQIWEDTLPDPRVIRVSYADEGLKIFLFQDFSRLSALLLTCQTSREVALRHFKPVYLTHAKPRPRLLYINFAQDTIFLIPPFPTNDSLKFASSFSDMKQLRFLAIGIFNPNFEDEMTDALLDLMITWTRGDSINLEEIKFVVNEETYGEFQVPQHVTFCEQELCQSPHPSLWGMLEVVYTRRYQAMCKRRGFKTMEKFSVRFVHTKMATKMTQKIPDFWNFRVRAGQIGA